MDALNFVKDMDIEKYSAVFAVGGDGIIHEVINGIMRREDKKKIPVGLIPNGSGNDTVGGFQIDNIKEAMQYVCKGDTVKVDVTKCLMDVESEEEITGDPAKHIRYSIVNSCLCLSANVNKNAARWKPFFGSQCYSI